MESDRNEIQALAFDSSANLENVCSVFCEPFPLYMYGDDYDDYLCNHRALMKIKTHDVVRGPRRMPGSKVPLGYPLSPFLHCFCFSLEVGGAPSLGLWTHRRTRRTDTCSYSLLGSAH